MTATLWKLVADFATTLNLKVAIWATSATLDSATDDDGVALPTWTYFLTIDRKSANKEYIKCTLTWTALTSIQNVSRQGALTSGFVRTHRKSATVEITDFAIIKKMLDLLDGTTDLNASVPLKYDGAATISNDNHLATKAYVDGVAIAGGADASTATKGISKLSYAPVSASDPIAVGDNDPRVPTTGENDALAGTSGTPSSTNKYVTADDVATAAAASKVARRLAGGNITVVTETTGNSTTNAASTAFVQQEITAANIPSKNNLMNSIIGTTPYITDKLFPTVWPTADAISNGWTELNAIMTASQWGGGIILFDTAANNDASIYTLLPWYGSQAYFRFADIWANAITVRTRVKFGTSPWATEAISFWFNALTELEDYAWTSSIRFCLADNSGDKLYAVTCDTTSPNTNTDVTGSLTLTDWLNLAMVITSTQVLFYAGNGSALTLVATHTTDLPTATTQLNLGWGIIDNWAQPDMYISPIYISLPTS